MSLLVFLIMPRPPRSSLLPYTTLFRSDPVGRDRRGHAGFFPPFPVAEPGRDRDRHPAEHPGRRGAGSVEIAMGRSEEHTSELQSRQYLVCRLLLEKKDSRTYCILDSHT